MADRPFYVPLFFPGRRVRVKGGPTGLVLRAIPVGTGLRIEVETAGGAGPSLRLHDIAELELLPADEETLRRDLVGRRVRFPRSSGIGIAFPPNATDDGVITLVRFEDGQPKLVVHVDCEGTDVKFVTPCDFRQCDLVPRPA